MTDSIPLSELEATAAAKFDQHGDRYAGRITQLKRQQQSDPATGQPKHFPSGDPMMLVLVTIQPADGDPVTLWAKGGKWTAKVGTGRSMQSAIGAAVAEAGASTIEVGGELAVAYTGDTEPTGPGRNPAKLFTASYRPPQPEAQAMPVDLFSE